MIKNISVTKIVKILVPSGITDKPVHEHGLRATPARTAFLAQERTHSIAPPKRKTSKKGDGEKVGTGISNPTVSKICVAVSGPVQTSTSTVGLVDGVVGSQVHDSSHANLHDVLY